MFSPVPLTQQHRWPERRVRLCLLAARSQSRGRLQVENKWYLEAPPPHTGWCSGSSSGCATQGSHSTGGHGDRALWFNNSRKIWTLWVIKTVLYVRPTFFSAEGQKARTRVCFSPGLRHRKAFRMEKTPRVSSSEDFNFWVRQEKAATHGFVCKQWRGMGSDQITKYSYSSYSSYWNPYGITAFLGTELLFFISLPKYTAEAKIIRSS